MAKRIALISDHASPLASAGGVDSGGQNIYVAQVAAHLARLGYGVDVFTRRDSSDLPDVVEWLPGVRVVHVPAGPPEFVPKEKLLPAMDEFCEWTCDFARRGGGYALSHANFFLSGLASIALKRRLGIPMVMTFHALGRVRRMHQKEADRFPAEREEIEELVIDEADAIVAECPQDWNDLTALYGAQPRRLAMIPCGFDKGEFWPIARPFARRMLGLPRDEPVLLNIGRLVPRKGIDNAIRALARLERKHGIAAKLLVVGGNSDLPDPATTPEIGRLMALAEAEGVAERAIFTGRRTREFLKLYYAAADAFVTTPWYEPFGITPLESMACGTPVIGADVGGIRYSVVDGVTGWLVPPDDPDALAERAARLCRDPQLSRDMGRAGVQRVNAHFSWRKVARSLAGLYERVARARVRPAAVAELVREAAA